MSKRPFSRILKICSMLNEKYDSCESNDLRAFLDAISRTLCEILFEVYKLIDNEGGKNMKKSNTGENKKTLEEKLEGLRKKVTLQNETVYMKSGCKVVDKLLGDGRGIPLGSIITVSGQSGTGKSTLILFLCKSFASQGKNVLYLDFESGVTDELIDGLKLSGNRDGTAEGEGRFVYYRPTDIADAEDIIQKLFDDVDIIVCDSATAMFPKKVAVVDTSEDIPVGIQARALSNFLMLYKGKISKTNKILFITAQMRYNLNFPAPTVLKEAGCQAMTFFPDIKISMSRHRYLEDNISSACSEKPKAGDAKKEGKLNVCSVNSIWCTKNRYGKSNVPAYICIRFGVGIYNEYNYMEFLKFHGKIVESNKSFSFKDIEELENERIHGEVELFKLMRDRFELFKKEIDKLGGFEIMYEKSKNPTKKLRNDEDVVTVENDGDTENII